MCGCKSLQDLKYLDLMKFMEAPKAELNIYSIAINPVTRDSINVYYIDKQLNLYTS